jgi:hypothetical protein
VWQDQDMKKKQWIRALLIVPTLTTGLLHAPKIAGCGVDVERALQPTNVFAIYRFAEPVDRRAITNADWKHVPLAKTPVISEADIMAYDFTNHLMTVKPEALKRLPKPAVSGTPFVVVARGERVYLGVFMTCVSSISVALPSIVVDEHMVDTNLPPNTLRIDRVYAAPHSKSEPDPRADERVMRALAWVLKIKC